MLSQSHPIPYYVTEVPNISMITLLEMQIFSPTPDLLNQKLGWDPATGVLTSPPDDSGAT